MTLTDKPQAVRAEALSPEDAVQAEHNRAGKERALVARQAHFAACDAGSLRVMHWQTAKLHLAAARVHDSTADRIEESLSRVRRASP